MVKFFDGAIWRIIMPYLNFREIYHLGQVDTRINELWNECAKESFEEITAANFHRLMGTYSLSSQSVLAMMEETGSVIAGGFALQTALGQQFVGTSDVDIYVSFLEVTVVHTYLQTVDYTIVPEFDEYRGMDVLMRPTVLKVVSFNNSHGAKVHVIQLREGVNPRNVCRNFDFTVCQVRILAVRRSDEANAGLTRLAPVISVDYHHDVANMVLRVTSATLDALRAMTRSPTRYWSGPIISDKLFHTHARAMKYMSRGFVVHTVRGRLGIPDQWSPPFGGTSQWDRDCRWGFTTAHYYALSTDLNVNRKLVELTLREGHGVLLQPLNSGWTPVQLLTTVQGYYSFYTEYGLPPIMMTSQQRQVCQEIRDSARETLFHRLELSLELLVMVPEIATCAHPSGYDYEEIFPDESLDPLKDSSFFPTIESIWEYTGLVSDIKLQLKRAKRDDIATKKRRREWEESEVSASDVSHMSDIEV